MVAAMVVRCGLSTTSSAHKTRLWQTSWMGSASRIVTAGSARLKSEEYLNVRQGQSQPQFAPDPLMLNPDRISFAGCGCRLAHVCLTARYRWNNSFWLASGFLRGPEHGRGPDQQRGI